MKPGVRIDGEPISPVSHGTIVEVEKGVYSILVDGASHEVRVVAGQVTVGNRRFDYEIDDPRQWKRSDDAAGGHGRAAILAPMPGKVVRILVAVGDEVEAGQGIVVVEAMKMQNEMKAPRAGRVAAIQVKENDSVVAGAVLAVIDPAPTGH
jgi:biotin carboxyl carrier protein